MKGLQMDGQPRAEAHVAAFNEAVGSKDWSRFAERFTEDAVMRFPQLPLAEAAGRDAIAAAYHAEPPDDTMTIRKLRTSGTEDHVGFTWSRGGTGTMVLRWHGNAIQLLEVFFDV